MTRNIARLYSCSFPRHTTIPCLICLYWFPSSSLGSRPGSSTSRCCRGNRRPAREVSFKVLQLSSSYYLAIYPVFFKLQFLYFRNNCGDLEVFYNSLEPHSSQLSLMFQPLLLRPSITRDIIMFLSSDCLCLLIMWLNTSQGI